MNHSASSAMDAAAGSAAQRTTRSTPSAPSPACRPQIAATRVGVSSRAPSRSGTSTKSFSVPCPFAARMVPRLRVGAAPGRRHVEVLCDLDGPAHQRRVVMAEPVHARVSAEPGFLAAGEAPGGPDRLLEGALLGPLAREVPQYVRVAQGAAGGSPLGEPGVLREVADL